MIDGGSGVLNCALLPHTAASPRSRLRISRLRSDLTFDQSTRFQTVSTDLSITSRFRQHRDGNEESGHISKWHREGKVWLAALVTPPLWRTLQRAAST